MASVLEPKASVKKFWLVVMFSDVRPLEVPTSGLVKLPLL